MIKKIFSLFIILSLSHCGFTPIYNDTNKILNTNNHTRTNIDYNVSEVYGLIILLSIGLFIINFIKIILV